MTERRRTDRVAETIKKYVAQALTRELFDPRLAGVMLTRVEVTSDLMLAKVYFRTVTALEGQVRKAVERAANRAAPTLRRGLGEQLATKRTPELQFCYDQGQDAMDRVEQLLGEIAAESAGRKDE